MWPFRRERTKEELEDEIIAETIRSAAFGQYIAMDGEYKLETDIKLAIAKKNLERLENS